MCKPSLIQCLSQSTTFPQYKHRLRGQRSPRTQTRTRTFNHRSRYVLLSTLKVVQLNVVPGEEYDGGYAYFGVNAAHNLTNASNFDWSQWLSSPPSPQDTPRVERAAMPFQVYAWTLLNTSSPWSTTFESSGSYSSYLVRFSLSGLPAPEDLRVELDGKDLGWVPRPHLGLDRWHYDIYHEGPLSAGSHELNFTLLNNTLEGVAQLCSAEIIEYGNATE